MYWLKSESTIISIFYFYNKYINLNTCFDVLLTSSYSRSWLGLSQCLSSNIPGATNSIVVSIASSMTLRRAKHCALEPRGPRTWISTQLCTSSSKVIILSQGPKHSFDPRHHWYKSEFDGSHVWVIFLSCAYINFNIFSSSVRCIFVIHMDYL